MSIRTAEDPKDPSAPPASNLEIFTKTGSGGVHSLWIMADDGVARELLSSFAADTILLDAIKSTPGTILKGQSVYIVAYDDANSAIEVELTDADSGATMPSRGLAVADFDNVTPGKIIITGLIGGVDTSLWPPNQRLHVSQTPGGLTDFHTPGPAIHQRIGHVVKQDATDGIILVWCQFEDHLSNSTPQPLGTATPGVSAFVSRNDHVHAHGAQGGGAGHALATGALAGFAPVLSTDTRDFLNGTGAYTEPTGAGGASFLSEWSYQVSVVAADPGSNNFRLNNAALPLVTEMYISDLPFGDMDAGVVLGTLTAGDQLKIKTFNDDDKAAFFTLTGDPVDGTGFWTIPITLDEETSTIFDTNVRCQVGFIFQSNHVKNNLAATTDPGTGNDNTENYSVGSTWLNTTTPEFFRAADVSTGAAVWVSLSVDSASLLTFGATTVAAAGTGDRYAFPWFQNNASPTSEIEMLIGVDCVISELRADWGPSSGSVNVDWVLRQNGGDSALTFTALSDAGTGSDLVNSVSFSAGDTASFVMRKSAGTSSAMTQMKISMRLAAS